MKACSCVCTKYVTLENLLIRWLLAELAVKPAYVAKEGDFSCSLGKWPVMVLGFGPLFPVSFCSCILLCVVAFYFPIPPCSWWSVSLLCSLCSSSLLGSSVFCLCVSPVSSSVFCAPVLVLQFLAPVISLFTRLDFGFLDSNPAFVCLVSGSLCVNCDMTYPQCPHPHVTLHHRRVWVKIILVSVCWGATVARMAFKNEKRMNKMVQGRSPIWHGLFCRQRNKTLLSI